MPTREPISTGIYNLDRPQILYSGEIPTTGKMTSCRLYTSSISPTASNDGFDSAGISQNFFIGDMWSNETDGVLYKCSDNTQNAAIWDILSSSAQAVKNVNSAAYTILGTDDFISVSYTATGSVSIQLPPSATVIGKIFTISDSGANAGTNNITVTPDGTDTIIGTETGMASATIDYNGSVYRFISIDSSTWKIW